MNEHNILGSELEVCSTDPMTGYRRNGYCSTDETDQGNHLVCSKMNKDFLNFTKSEGNDLTSVVKAGDNWCLCQNRWLQAYNAGKAPEVIKNATNNKIRQEVKDAIILQKGAGRKKKTRKKQKKQKKQFLYNPNDPSKSFDVYIDKNPNDTIPIKYTTVKDVEDTIKKLERLYKTKKYPHKRIWQVGMIMKVRLEAMNKYKKTRYPNAKNVFKRYQLSKRYFKFLGKRSKKKSFEDRKKMTFNIKMKKKKTRRGGGGKKKKKNKTKKKKPNIKKKGGSQET